MYLARLHRRLCDMSCVVHLYGAVVSIVSSASSRQLYIYIYGWIATAICTILFANRYIHIIDVCSMRAVRPNSFTVQTVRYIFALLKCNDYSFFFLSSLSKIQILSVMVRF